MLKMELPSREKRERPQLMDVVQEKMQRVVVTEEDTGDRMIHCDHISGRYSWQQD